MVASITKPTQIKEENWKKFVSLVRGTDYCLLETQYVMGEEEEKLQTVLPPLQLRPERVSSPVVTWTQNLLLSLRT